MLVVRAAELGLGIATGDEPGKDGQCGIANWDQIGEEHNWMSVTGGGQTETANWGPNEEGHSSVSVTGAGQTETPS